jgi:hypothetical protein
MATGEMYTTRRPYDVQHAESLPCPTPCGGAELVLRGRRRVLRAPHGAAQARASAKKRLLARRYGATLLVRACCALPHVRNVGA